LFALLGVATLPRAAAQPGGNLIEMEVEAAFDGFFRDEQWFPVRVTVTNNSDPVVGRVIVRPETSRGVRGAFSLPMQLPTNAVMSDVMYVAAQGVTTQLRVELIDDQDELVLASQTVALRALQPTDQLYAVITRSAAGSIDMTGAVADGLSASQANWDIDSIPDNPAALASVNMIVFTDVDTNGLTLAQETALEGWVANGGHLVVTGGINWQATAAGLERLLPFAPGDDIIIDDVSVLASYVGSDAALTGDIPLAVGTVDTDAEILVETGLREPLLVRGTLGEGVVDYLALDPNTAPLRGWDGLNPLWYTLAATSPPVPAWTRNFATWDRTINAAEILPGIDVLPSVLPICGFLALYIALIGPVNYLILDRLNRREWAWVSIPLLIVLFSVLAFVVGGQLRGTIANIGRIAVVRAYPDTNIAHTTEIMGLLSPQRTQYTLEAQNGVLMRALPRNMLQGGSLLASTFQTSIEFQQAEQVRAFEFPVDASFIAGFAAYGTTEAPDIRGNASLFYPVSERAVQIVRGSVRNNSDLTLTDGVVLARGKAYRFAGDLAPGDIANFEIRLDTFEVPAPAPIGYPLAQAGALGMSSNALPDRTVRDIMGESNYNFNTNLNAPDRQAETVERQEQRRRQLFLSALTQETYISTARGNDVYFVGWDADEATTVTLADQDYDPYATTAYIIALDVEVEQPLNKRVRVGSDQFVWAVHERVGLGAAAPVNFSVGEGNSIAFRYTPFREARLDDVEELYVVVQRSSGTTNIPVEVWNWDDQTWERFIITNDRLEIEDPDAYLGAANDTIVRVLGDEVSFMNFNAMRVEHVGTFTG